jgi:hypothetical protein
LPTCGQRSSYEPSSFLCSGPSPPSTDALAFRTTSHFRRRRGLQFDVEWGGYRETASGRKPNRRYDPTFCLSFSPVLRYESAENKAKSTRFRTTERPISSRSAGRYEVLVGPSLIPRGCSLGTSLSRRIRGLT